MSYTRKLAVAVLMVGLFASSVVLINRLLSERASAATTWSHTESPSNYGSLCTGSVRVDFAAKITNVDFNPSTGKGSYKIDFEWKRCDNRDTAAYAIYGSNKVCPKSGTYGEDGDAYDCLKYIGNPKYHGVFGLTCPQGTNTDCVTSKFHSVKEPANQPTKTVEKDSVPLDFQINNMGLSGSRQVINNQKLCEFFKLGLNTNDYQSAQQCINFNLEITWTTPNGNPSGNIGIACVNPAAHQQKITYNNISDADSTSSNRVKAQVKDGSTVIIAATTATSGTKTVTDAGGKTYVLYVLDVKPGGGNDGYKEVGNVTSRPCNGPGAAISASCSIGTNPTGWLEIDSQAFSATYLGSVSGVPADTSTTTGGNWSAPSGVAKRTYTKTDTSYTVVQNTFDSKYTGTPSQQSASAPDGNPTSHTFTGFGPESTPLTYTVSGTYSYVVQKTVTVSQRTDTRDKKGTVSTGSFSPVSSNTTDIVPNGLADCVSASIIYGVRPYLSVYSGDIAAGAYQQDGRSGCQTNGSAGITSWNHDSNTDYSGAGAEAGAYAVAHIKSFASALGTANPLRLSFANTTSAASGSGNYGGDFGAASLPTSCNFMSDVGGGASTPSLPTTDGYGDSSYSGHQTYVVRNQDVYISSDVRYGNQAATSAGDIPRFKLVVVGGSIYIGAGVTELDGLYVAMPNSGGSGGTIYTCATGLGSAVPTSQLYNRCNNKLTVYGAFAAKQVQFLRASGSLKDSKTTDAWQSNSSAETFVYSPEMWLPDGSGSKNLNYDAILGLPPVL